MNSAKVFSVISLTSATMVASFMVLMIIRSTMPIMQMAPFIGLNGAIVGGLFYLGIDAITSISTGAASPAQPKIIMVRDKSGQILAIRTEEAQQQDDALTFFQGLEEFSESNEFAEKVPLSQRLRSTSKKMIETIKTVLLIALMLETYMGIAYLSANFIPFMVVISKSMEPTLKVGDLIYVKGVAPVDIKVGDIITFKLPATYIKGTLITHRVIEVTYESNEIYYKTRGDNNPDTDPWTVKSGGIIGVQKAVIPNMGGFFLWIKTSTGIATLGIILIIYLFCSNIKENFGGLKLEL